VQVQREPSRSRRSQVQREPSRSRRSQAQRPAQASVPGRGGRGFKAVIDLAPQHGADFLQPAGEVLRGARTNDAPEHEEPCHRIDIGVDRVGHTRVLDLQADRQPVNTPPREMHLPERGSSNRNGIDLELGEAALAELDAVERSPLGSKFPTVGAAWRRAWDRVIPFFTFPPEVRKVIYTTNAIESVNARLRKIIKTRGHFPNDDAAAKLIWLALRNITADWGRAANNWKTAMNQFAILYADRFTQPNHASAK
jgi:hypothetical protein